MRKTLKYRLYTSKQDKHLVEQIHVAASIWNHSVALTRRYYRLYGEHLPVARLMKHIAKLRRKDPYWQKLGSQAVQDVCQRLDKAYQRFFAKPGPVGRPGFKKRTKYSSFTLKQAGWKLVGPNKLRVGRKHYKFALSRPLPVGGRQEGTIKTVTIKRDRAGRLWVCFSVVLQSEYPTPNEAVMRPVGLDFGLKDFLTTSDGHRIESPLFFKQRRDGLARLQRSLSRKKKDSNRRRKARMKKAKYEATTAAMRRDFHFKLAHRLCDQYDAIGVEDLNLDGMKRRAGSRRRWGRKVSDLGFGYFVEILHHVAAKRGVHVVTVGRFYPSSKTCSECGEVNKDLALSDRVWRCGGCGAVHDRDVNAAINIRGRAFPHGVGGVRPARLAIAT
ncbi:MAG: transposase [Bacteroidota bacterium]